MGIQLLPPDTVRRLRSAQVIVDGLSVVKELIDNALDARATSIFVDVSANCLDTIQVRDNGHGISPIDRALLCKHHCTSKIKAYTDINTLGGRSLGFRGEALACIAELCGAVVVTTRVEGESTAIRLEFDGNGIQNKFALNDRTDTLCLLTILPRREPASNATGTTVRACRLFERVPVRKQSAAKTSSAHVQKIKNLLRAFAMTRPSVRFALHVLKPQKDNDNWVYVPASPPSFEDCALKITGISCASQCKLTSLQMNGFTLEAFLPTVSAEPSKICNVGIFVSIDSRPVSSSQGTIKTLMKLYRQRMKSSLPMGNDYDIRDPFLYLSIACPEGSYDVNVEPSKDSVIFWNPMDLVVAMEALLKAHYPSPLPSSSTSISAVGLDSTISSQNIERREISLTEIGLHPRQRNIEDFLSITAPPHDTASNRISHPSADPRVFTSPSVRTGTSLPPTTSFRSSTVPSVSQIVPYMTASPAMIEQSGSSLLSDPAIAINPSQILQPPRRPLADRTSSSLNRRARPGERSPLFRPFRPPSLRPANAVTPVSAEPSGSIINYARDLSPPGHVHEPPVRRNRRLTVHSPQPDDTCEPSYRHGPSAVYPHRQQTRKRRGSHGDEEIQAPTIENATARHDDGRGGNSTPPNANEHDRPLKRLGCNATAGVHGMTREMLADPERWKPMARHGIEWAYMLEMSSGRAAGPNAELPTSFNIPRLQEDELQSWREILIEWYRQEGRDVASRINMGILQRRSVQDML